MTIQITYADAEKTKSYIYRKVYKGKNLAQYVEGFYAQHDNFRWGVMAQLKGKEIIRLHEFGIIQ